MVIEWLIHDDYRRLKYYQIDSFSPRILFYILRGFNFPLLVHVRLLERNILFTAKNDHIRTEIALMPPFHFIFIHITQNFITLFFGTARVKKYSYQ